MNKTKLITLALLALLIPCLSGAKSQYTFRHLTTREGLSSNTVRALIQDHTGLIWMGTSNGLDSFDGREVIHHPIPAQQSTYVNSIIEDQDGLLWIGTDDGVYRYDGAQMSRLGNYPGHPVGCLAMDTDGNLWIGTLGHGIFRYDGTGFTAFMQDGSSIESFYVSRSGRLWVTNMAGSHNLFVYNPATESFVIPAFTYKNCEPARVCVMDQDSSGNLWLGTWDQGLYHLDSGSLTITQVLGPEKGFTHIHSITQETPFVFLIGSDDGLLRVNPLTGESTLYTNDRNNPASLSNKFVYPIVRDHENGLWIGTYYGGVNYVSPSIGQFSTLSLSHLTGADEDFSVSCFCEDPDGGVWMGSDNGGLFRYDPSREEAVRWKYPSLNIHALCRRGEDLWIGSYTNALIRLNLRTGISREYEGSTTSTYSLYNDENGTLWAGTPTSILRYDSAADAFVEERVLGDQTSAILGDGKGTLWFGTDGQGVQVRRPDGSWDVMDTENSALPSNFVNCLMMLPDGLYAGTTRGIATPAGEVILEDVEANYIASDGNQLWITTSSALLRYNPRTRETEQFGANDGVNSTLFLVNAGMMATDGTIYTGASDGFLTFFPGNVQANQVRPTVMITRFYATRAGEKENVFVTQGKDDIRLHWRTETLDLSFAALSYIAPEKVRFRYRLEGRDSEWINLEDQNRITVSQLRPGHYTLHVQACNNSNVWNTDGERLSFTVRPHPLASHLAVILYVLLGGLAAWLLVRHLVRRYDEKSKGRFEKQLDAIVSHVKEEERDDRYQFLSSLTDQLEAPVSGIELQLQKLKGSPYKNELAVIEKNQRMLRSITGNLRQMKAAIHPERAAEGPTTRDEDFLAQLDKLITDNLANPELSVSFLAQEMAVSRSGLFAKAKQLSGETPNNLINQARLNAAANLLSEGKYSVGEICYMTGFSSPSYFSKIFASQFGLTPHEWAKKNTEEAGLL